PSAGSDRRNDSRSAALSSRAGGLVRRDGRRGDRRSQWTDVSRSGTPGAQLGCRDDRRFGAGGRRRCGHAPGRLLRMAMAKSHGLPTAAPADETAARASGPDALYHAVLLVISSVVLLAAVLLSIRNQTQVLLPFIEV